MPISSHSSVVFSPLRACSVNQSRPYFDASLATCRAQLLPLLGLGEGVSVCLLTVGEPGPPGATCCADGDVDLGDRAVVRRGHGVLHLHRLEHQHGVARRHVGAGSTATTLTTVPGIGASRLPLATASAGSVNRGAPATSATSPGPSRRRPRRRRPRRRTPWRTPSTSRITRSARTSTTGHAVDDVAVAGAPPLDHDVVVAVEAGALRLARPRCASRPGSAAGRCGRPRRSARATAAASASTGRASVAGAAPKPAVGEEGGVTSPATNTGSPQHRDQLVAVGGDPWMRARAAARPRASGRRSRVGAWRRPWRASRRSGRDSSPEPTPRRPRVDADPGRVAGISKR